MSDLLGYQVNPSCLVCGSSIQKKLGVRGNREFVNAPQNVEHLSTNVVQCRDCTFIYCNPSIIGAETLENIHYSNAEVYSATTHEDIAKPFLFGLKKIQSHSVGKKLLDVGAGKGEFLAIAREKGFLVHGFEPSPEFCSFANRQFKVDVHCGDLISFNKVSDPRIKFDVISLFHVLEHVKNPKNLLFDLLPLLEKEGICYIEVPNADALMLRVVDKIYMLLGRGWSSRLSPLHPPFHSIGYTKKSIRMLLEISGFDVKEIATFSGRNRGHQVDRRFGPITKLFRNAFVGFFGLLPNKELIGVVVIPESPDKC